MAIFQKSVFFIFLIIFVISIIFIIIGLRNSSSKTTWPPIIGSCPDYWLNSPDKDGLCINNKKLGTCNNKEMDFSVAPFIGTNSLCEKYKWANSCNVIWDGISNVTNPCNNTPS